MPERLPDTPEMSDPGSHFLQFLSRVLGALGAARSWQTNVLKKILTTNNCKKGTEIKVMAIIN
jgi:hypothetical protein